MRTGTGCPNICRKLYLMADHEEPRDIIDRVIQKRFCRSGNIKDLKPAAFKPSDKYPDVLSFADRDKQSPTETLAEYNKDPNADGAIKGEWTVGLHVAEVKRVICVHSVVSDGGKDGNPEAHVSAHLTANRSEDDENERREQMKELAVKSELST